MKIHTLSMSSLICKWSGDKGEMLVLLWVTPGQWIIQDNRDWRCSIATPLSLSWIHVRYISPLYPLGKDLRDMNTHAVSQLIKVTTRRIIHHITLLHFSWFNFHVFLISSWIWLPPPTNHHLYGFRSPKLTYSLIFKIFIFNMGVKCSVRKVTRKNISK
jgi:hypothetical protein